MFFQISHHSLWYELLQIKDTQWNVILKLLLISPKKLTDEWQTLVFYVLGLKLPLVPCGIGDGDQSNSRVLYTHSNDSMLKVGWSSQTIGVWTLAQIIVINVITCVVIPYIMLGPQRHMWYLPWSLIIFDRFSDSWHCQQMMYSFDFLVPAKISGRIRPGKVYDMTIHMTLYFYIFLLRRWDLCHAVAGCQLWANLSSFRAANRSSKRGGLEFVVGRSFERGNDTRWSLFHNSLELFLGDMWKPVKTVGPDFRLKQNSWKTGGEEKHI